MSILSLYTEAEDRATSSKLYIASGNERKVSGVSNVVTSDMDILIRTSESQVSYFELDKCYHWAETVDALTTVCS